MKLHLVKFDENQFCLLVIEPDLTTVCHSYSPDEFDPTPDLLPFLVFGPETEMDRHLYENRPYTIIQTLYDDD